MMPLFAAKNLDRDRHPLRASRTIVSERLNGLAASPWAISFTSFLVTALLIRSVV